MRQQKFDSVVVRTQEGYETATVPNKVSDAFKAADALAQRYGLYLEKPATEDKNAPKTGQVALPVKLPYKEEPEDAAARLADIARKREPR
jgi:hypothetical protein